MRLMKLSILLSLFFLNGLFGQVLNVSVKLEMDHLIDEARDELSNFTEKIEDYYNAYQWTEDEFEYDVTCNIHIIIETVQKKSADKVFRAQFLISSVSGESFYDKTWEFPYDRNATLTHVVSQFDPVAAFLDYYAYMILAGELIQTVCFLVIRCTNGRRMFVTGLYYQIMPEAGKTGKMNF